MILFLNKLDIFEQKITKTDLKVCFPEYRGGKDAEAARRFIEEIFLAQNDNPSKPVYIHFTCATDTVTNFLIHQKNVEVVFRTCKDIILKRALDGLGM